MKNIKTIFDKIETFVKKINPKSPKFIIATILVLIILTAGTVTSYINYQEKAASGMIYKGLGPRQKSGPCVGIFAAQLPYGNSICSHGPDPAPDGIDVRKRKEPEDTATKSKTNSVNEKAVAGITCSSDGIRGKRIQAMYVRSSDMPDNYGQYVGSIKHWASQIDQAVKDSAAKTGGNRYLRFVHDSGCEIIVENIVISPEGDDTPANTVKELSDRGYNRNNRKYLIWRDANIICAQGFWFPDDSPGLLNRNNIEEGYALIDNGCWGGENRSVEMHELVHALGGINHSAPHATGYGHCNDGHDSACYADGGPRSNYQVVCGDPSDLWRWDCNNDDYFSTNPPGDSYLASHWNIANSEFLGGDEDKRPKFVPSAAGDVYAVNREGGSGKTEIHALSGSSEFREFSIHAQSGLHATQGRDWSFAIGNFYDGDNLIDIYAINRNGAEGKTEVHVLSGKSNFAEFVLQSSTGLEITTGDNWVFDVGNGPDGDPNADLFAINKQGASGKTEVHILQGGPGKDYKDFSLHAETGLHATDKNWDFVIGWFSDNANFSSDIYAINRNGASGKTEVHVLSAESEYKDFSLHVSTPLESTTNSNWSFTAGFFDNDLKADLYAINRNGASGRTEVHVLSGESNFSEFILHAASGLEPTNNSNWTFTPSQDFQSATAPDPVDPNPVAPDPVDPNNPDPVDPNPNPVDPNPQEPIVPDPVAPDPVDPVDPNPQDPVDPDPVNPDDPPPFVCGGSPDSICTSPTVTIPPIDSGQEDCLDPRGTTEKINDWVNRYIRRVQNYIDSLLGNPQQPPPPPVPCVRQ